MPLHPCNDKMKIKRKLGKDNDMNKMAMCIYLLLLLPTIVSAASQNDPLKIDYPNVIVHAQKTGDLTAMSGYNGDIRLLPGANNTGSAFFEGDDLLYIFQIVTSLPPVWIDHSPFGYLGEFHSGQKIDVTLQAADPEGGKIVYSLIAGSFPPGVSLDPSTGRVHGLAPDSDAIYTFTIRATDSHGKHADNVFKIVTRGIDSCKNNPCQHEGHCHDTVNGTRCSCIHPYGGKRCELACTTHRLGVSDSNIIPNAQMTAYNTYSTYTAYQGRYSGSGWYGVNASSWLQIDLGNLTEIHGSYMRGCSTYYYTSYYYLEYSLDGNNFLNYTSITDASTIRLTGYSGSSSRKTSFPQPFEARFVRFRPLSWYSSSSYRPCMRVDLFGCHKY